jgi:Protein of unknown function C-terminus (DUF2399)
MAATDQVSSTVLTYGLMPPGDDWPSRLLRERTRPAGGCAGICRPAPRSSHVRIARDRATPLQPLSGQLTAADWDPELAPAMRAMGVGVQEESALEFLLADLDPAGA